MAIPRRLPVDFGVAFPHGAFLVSEVVPVSDFERSTRDNKIQQTDPETGEPLWSVEVVDADPEAKKAFRTVTVKLPAKVQPVPPANDGSSPFTPVVFEGLTALPYVEEVTATFSRVAWSFRATSMAAAGKNPGKPTSDKGERAAA